jgi:hypothetical protein
MAGSIQFTTKWADLEQYARLGQDPVGIEPRGREEEWLVARSPAIPERPVEWALVRDGDAVYVPLIPYLAGTDPESVFSAMLGRGVLMGIELNAMRGQILRVLLIRGRPVEDLRPTQESFRFWMGMAIRIR